MTELQISNSEIQKFKRCRRAWYAEFYRGLRLKAEKPVGAGKLGDRVHYALATYYGTREDPLAHLAQTYAMVRELASEGYEKDIATEEELAKAMVEGYLDWVATEGVDADYEIIASEGALVAPFADVLGVHIKLSGKLDLQVRRLSDSARLFLDHKTVTSMTQPVLHLNEQVYMYCLLQRLALVEAEWADGGIFNLLKKVKRTARAKPPFFGRAEVRHNTDSMRAFWKRTYGTVTDIVTTRQRLDAGEDPNVVVYPTPRRDCSWDCAFLAACPMFDNGEDVEGFLATFYEAHDPYARYHTDDSVVA